MKKLACRGCVDYIAEHQYRYYYSVLPTKLRDAYRILLEGYMMHKTAIEVSVSCVDNVLLVHKSLCYDVPELFFIKTIRYSYEPLSSTITIYPSYRFDYETCLNILMQMEIQTKSLIHGTALLSEWERIKQIHDFLIRNVTYKDLKAPYSHESPGALLYGIAVCEGIAKAYKYLLDRVNIQSLVVIGKSIDNISPPGELSGHAWNIVFVNSHLYHIDVTFDYAMSCKKTVRYDYFLLSDSQMQTDHFFMNMPACNYSYEYYLTINHFADSKRRLQLLARNYLKPGYPLVVKIPDFHIAVEDVSEQLLDIVYLSLPEPLRTQYSLVASYNVFRNIIQFDLN